MSDLPRFILLSTGESIPLSVLEFATSRSGGPGGQNVNKVETRVEVRFAPAEAAGLSDETRHLLLERLSSRLDSNGRLRVVSATERTQRGNRAAALHRLTLILNSALHREKPRTATRPTRASKMRRREAKQRTSEKKAGRRWRSD